MLTLDMVAMEIVSEIRDAVNHNINIMDTSGKIIASTDLKRIGSLHSGALEVLKKNLVSMTVQNDDEELGIRQGINLPIRFQNQIVGVVGITGEVQEISNLGCIVQRMTEIILKNAFIQEQESILFQARQCFLENLLFSENQPLADLEARGKMLGIDISQKWIVAVLRVGSAQYNREIDNANVIKLLRPYIPSKIDSAYAVVNQKILLLFQSTDMRMIRNRVVELCESMEHTLHTPVYGGICARARNEMDIRRNYKEAVTACKSALENKNRVCSYDETSLEFLIGNIGPAVQRDVCDLVFAGCQLDVIADICDIVLLYYQCKGNTEVMAEKLFVHKNTVQYRLQKIKSETGYNIRYPRDATLLYMASIFQSMSQRKEKP